MGSVESVDESRKRQILCEITRAYQSSRLATEKLSHTPAILLRFLRALIAQIVLFATRFLGRIGSNLQI